MQNKLLLVKTLFQIKHLETCPILCYSCQYLLHICFGSCPWIRICINKPIINTFSDFTIRLPQKQQGAIQNLLPGLRLIMIPWDFNNWNKSLTSSLVTSLVGYLIAGLCKGIRDNGTRHLTSLWQTFSLLCHLTCCKPCSKEPPSTLDYFLSNWSNTEIWFSVLFSNFPIEP